MNSVQVHLALTHVPVILSIVGLVMLVAAFFIKNSTITKISYILLVVAGLFAIPVFLTGEGAEEAVEKLPGVSETIIEEHEEAASLAMIAISAAAVVALVSLCSFKWPTVARFFKLGVLVLAITSALFMIQTAHLGGQVRHSEIRQQAAGQHNPENKAVINGQYEKDEDD
jgi:uncharacterized membrane protein